MHSNEQQQSEVSPRQCFPPGTQEEMKRGSPGSTGTLCVGRSLHFYPLAGKLWQMPITCANGRFWPHSNCLHILCSSGIGWSLEDLATANNINPNIQNKIAHYWQYLKGWLFLLLVMDQVQKVSRDLKLVVCKQDGLCTEEYTKTHSNFGRLRKNKSQTNQQPWGNPSWCLFAFPGQVAYDG